MNPPKIYGLIGYPVNHSLSPLMHNAAFSYLKINAQYRIFPLQEKEIGPFLRGARQNNIFGLNVTVPYKEKVIPFLDSISGEAKLIGAVNTIKLSGSRLLGFNTDGEGFLRHLKEDLAFNPEDKNIALIGAGGAARAISVYLSKTGPRRLSIYDIDRAKLSALVNHLKANFKDVNIRSAGSIEGLDIGSADLLVNATPVGMKETDPCLIDKESIHKEMLVYDLIYEPKQTKLLNAAELKGARVSNGLGMLLYQGMLAFELWTGKKAPKKVMQNALLNEDETYGAKRS